jgi:hypothetical protein
MVNLSPNLDFFVLTFPFAAPVPIPLSVPVKLLKNIKVSMAPLDVRKTVLMITCHTPQSYMVGRWSLMPQPEWLWPLFHLRDGGKWTEMTATQHGGTLRH